MRKAILLAVVLMRPAFCQEVAVPCLVPEDALEDLKFTLAFEWEFRTEYVQAVLPKPGDPWKTNIEYTWRNLGLYFFLPGSETIFGYDPSSVRRAVGSQISPIRCNPDEDLVRCLNRTLPPSASLQGSSDAKIAALSGTSARPLDVSAKKVCAIQVSVPKWEPSQDSELKRYIVEKIRERLPIELPGKPRRILMSDFNVKDPRVFVYAEVDTLDAGPQRLWLPATLNFRRIPEPVRLTRMGASLVEDGDPVDILMTHPIRLFP
jgi:hypothetical protein